MINDPGTRPSKSGDTVSTFEIPDELAQELSELMTIRSIRMNLLMSMVDQPSGYEQVEKSLIPIEEKLSAIKAKITEEYVPLPYRLAKYSWTFTGYFDGNTTVLIKLT